MYPGLWLQPDPVSRLRAARRRGARACAGRPRTSAPPRRCASAARGGGGARRARRARRGSCLLRPRSCPRRSLLPACSIARPCSRRASSRRASSSLCAASSACVRANAFSACLELRRAVSRSGRGGLLRPARRSCGRARPPPDMIVRSRAASSFSRRFSSCARAARPTCAWTSASSAPAGRADIPPRLDLRDRVCELRAPSSRRRRLARSAPCAGGRAPPPRRYGSRAGGRARHRSRPARSLPRDDRKGARRR